jgi:hypothetical protein
MLIVIPLKIMSIDYVHYCGWGDTNFQNKPMSKKRVGINRKGAFPDLAAADLSQWRPRKLPGNRLAKSLEFGEAPFIEPECRRWFHSIGRARAEISAASLWLCEVLAASLCR